MNAPSRLFCRLARLPLRPGFTLIEIIFAAGLLALVMVMVFNLFPTSLFSIRLAEHRLKAASQGQSVLDAAREESVQRLATSVPTFLPSCMIMQGNDGTWYVTDRTVNLTPASPWMSPMAVNTGSCGGPPQYRLIEVQATTWWNERNDTPVVSAYTSWKPHNIVQQILISEISND